jgi:hypothetical protein
MRAMRGNRRLLTFGATCCFVLAFSLGAGPQEIKAKKSGLQSNAGATEKSGAPGRLAEIEKLAKMLIGNWDVVASLEPSATTKGRKDRGSNRIVLGPGGRSVIENYHTDGDSGSRAGLGILWWDEKAKGYRTMFCDNADPAGCSVYDGLGRWEGGDLVFRFRRDRDGNRIDGKEVFTPISPFSYTVRFFESRNGGPEDATWTVTNTKAE